MGPLPTFKFFIFSKMEAKLQAPQMELCLKGVALALFSFVPIGCSLILGEPLVAWHAEKSTEECNQVLAGWTIFLLVLWEVGWANIKGGGLLSIVVLRIRKLFSLLHLSTPELWHSLGHDQPHWTVLGSLQPLNCSWFRCKCRTASPTNMGRLLEANILLSSLSINKIVRSSEFTIVLQNLWDLWHL